MSREATLLRTLGILVLAAAAGCAGPKVGSDSVPPRASFDANATPEALVALADSAIAAAQPNLARRALERAAEIAPQSAAVRMGYGRYYTAILRYKDAKTEFERAAALDPSSAEPHYWLGVAYLKGGEKNDAWRSLAGALRLDPSHAGARAALRPLLEERYRAAGVPVEYAAMAERPTVSRAELGVMLAVELGVDPDRSVWRSDAAHRTDWPALDTSWGPRWLRASVARGWIGPHADEDLHLDDPVTRGSLALLLAELQIRLGPPRDSSRSAPRPADPAPALDFSDLGARHYLSRAAARAVSLGLPTRDGGRFEAQAFATGLETLRALQGLARFVGATPLVSSDPGDSGLVK